jgi:hypothetical protein
MAAAASSSAVSHPVERLQQEGQLESQGSFTLDSAAALQKLSTRLLQPEDCLLYLLQSAVASGASWMTVNSGPGELVVSHDGFFPGPDQAGDILGWALGSGRVREQVPQHRLGMALAAALTPPGRGLQLEFPDGSAISIGPQPFKQPKPADPGQSRIHIPLRVSLWGRFLGTSRCTAVQRFRERARFAPLHLEVDGKPVSGQEFGKPLGGTSWAIWSDNTILDGDAIFHSDHHLLELRIPYPSHNCDWLALPLASLASVRFEPDFQNSTRMLTHAAGAYSVAACAAVCVWTVNRPSRIEVVQYGVSLMPLADLNLPGRLRLTTADHEAVTDLTFLKPVLNDPLRDKIGRLCERCDEAFGPIQRLYEQTDRRQRYELWVIDMRGRLPKPAWSR